MRYTLRTRDDIDYEAAVGGAAVARAHMEEVKRRLKEEKNAKDEDVLVSLQLVNEMLVRGYEFLPIELGKSYASKYVWRTAKCACPLPPSAAWAKLPLWRWNRLPSMGRNISRWKNCSKPPAWRSRYSTNCTKSALWEICRKPARLTCSA